MAKDVPHLRLLVPDPIPPTGLTSWDQEVDWLNSLPPRIRDKLYDKFGKLAESAVADIHHLAAMDRTVIALLGACICGVVTVFVAANEFTRFHQIRSHVWKLPGEDVANPLRLARHGRFLIVSDLVPRNSLEEVLAGRPLFLFHSQLKQALSIPNPSRAQLRRIGVCIIKKYIDKNPQVRLRRNDFVQALKADCPTVGRREALNVWSEVAPKTWRKAGRLRTVK
jgi:hypothetical protein